VKYHLHLDFKRFTLQIGLTGFALMVGYLTLFWESGQTVLPRATDADLVDFYAENLRGRRFDGAGALQQTLTAEQMVHYRSSDEARLREPRFTSVGADGRRWHSEARAATLVGDDEVRLQREVVIREIDGAARLTTDHLNWYPPGQRVETDAAVTIIETGHTLRGVGLRADLERRHSELLHHVEGLHEPQ
jgi:LPS export ABC transporter protein LptC